MDEKLTFVETLMKTANKNANEINDTNTNGIRELTLIEETINKNWNDKNGNNAVSNLKLFQQKQKTENNLLFNYKKALEKATNNASKVGEQINISISNVDTQLAKAEASITSPIQSAANTLNQAAGLAPKFAGEINSAISDLQTATTSMGTLGKNVKITIEDIRTLEQDLSSDLDNININNTGYDAIDFSKVSTSIDSAQKGEYIKISEMTRETYWKDCELKETNEPGIYLAIKDGIALGYVKIKDNTKVTTETKIEDKNKTNATIKENQNQKENYVPSSAQVEIDKYERTKKEKEKEDYLKNYIPSSAQVEMDKARRAGVKVPIAGATNTYSIPATGNKSIDELRNQFGLYDGNGNRNINNKFGYYNKSLTNTQTEVLNKMDVFSKQNGISEQDMRDWTYMVGRESGFKPSSTNGTHYGLGQLTEGNIAKYAPSGDYKTNVDTQISAMYKYTLDRYGSISNARKFWDSHGWY